jgi:hypothetical protein
MTKGFQHVFNAPSVRVANGGRLPLLGVNSESVIGSREISGSV